MEYKFLLKRLSNITLSNLWADKNPLFNFSISKKWKLAALVETFTTVVQGFHKVLHKPLLYT